MSEVQGVIINVAIDVRKERIVPDAYRLAKKQDGTLILQGAYMWQQGRDYGHKWRDIPTVELS